MAMELGPVRLAAQAAEDQVLNEALVLGFGTLRTVSRQSPYRTTKKKPHS